MNAAEWTNLSSGLIGAAIGAMIGFLGSVLLSWLAERSKQRAAGRALLAEIVSNLEALKYPSEHRPAGYSQTVWETQLPLVAALLHWNELQTVAEPYLLAAEPLYGFLRAEQLRERSFQASQSAQNSGPIQLQYSAGVQDDHEILNSLEYYAGIRDAVDAEEVLKKCQEELAKAREKFAIAAILLRDKLLTRGEARGLATLIGQNRDGATPKENTPPTT